ncbi:MAG TPA: MucB/RseB C-terminal domain-containing protein, partial [Burkholderiaceae bacterium]
RSVNCYRRPVSGADGKTVQWFFSDGLATVSLFVEPYEPARHAQDRQFVMGATRTLMQRVAGNWWLTAVGEVPMNTLKMFADNLERTR